MWWVNYEIYQNLAKFSKHLKILGCVKMWQCMNDSDCEKLCEMQCKMWGIKTRYNGSEYTYYIVKLLPFRENPVISGETDIFIVYIMYWLTFLYKHILLVNSTKLITKHRNTDTRQKQWQKLRWIILLILREY